MWVICISCHHAVNIKPLKKNARLRCTACGSAVARTVRVVKQHMLNGGQMPADIARQLTLSGLTSIAKERGYSQGWVSHKYRAIYGTWPESRTPPEPTAPNGELTWWIKQQNIAYAREHFPREKKVKPEEKSSTLMSEDDWGVDL